MKQGVIILAHKNINHIKQIFEALDDRFRFYLIIDKSCSIANEILGSDLINDNRLIKINSSNKINWGSSLIVSAILEASADILECADIQYIHLLSGQDFPIKDSDTIASYLESQKGREFIEMFSLPTERWYKGGENRVSHYYLFDLFKARTGIIRRVNNLLVDFQYKLGVKRKFKPTDLRLHGGSMWWTLTRSCLDYVVKYVKSHPEILKSIKHSFCSDEILFPTIIMNSPFASQVVNNNLRFICWEHRNGNYPANLDLSDLEAIQKSECLFARKFEHPVSTSLLNTLLKNDTSHSE